MLTGQTDQSTTASLPSVFGFQDIVETSTTPQPSDLFYFPDMAWMGGEHDGHPRSTSLSGYVWARLPTTKSRRDHLALWQSALSFEHQFPSSVESNLRFLKLVVALPVHPYLLNTQIQIGRRSTIGTLTGERSPERIRVTIPLRSSTQRGRVCIGCRDNYLKGHHWSGRGDWGCASRRWQVAGCVDG